jgi:hypothetical protein
MADSLDLIPFSDTIEVVKFLWPHMVPPIGPPPQLQRQVFATASVIMMIRISNSDL